MTMNREATMAIARRPVNPKLPEVRGCRKSQCSDVPKERSFTPETRLEWSPVEDFDFGLATDCTFSLQRHVRTRTWLPQDDADCAWPPIEHSDYAENCHSAYATDASWLRLDEVDCAWLPSERRATENRCEVDRLATALGTLLLAALFEDAAGQITSLLAAACAHDHKSRSDDGHTGPSRPAWPPSGQIGG